MTKPDIDVTVDPSPRPQPEPVLIEPKVPRDADNDPVIEALRILARAGRRDVQTPAFKSPINGE